MIIVINKIVLNFLNSFEKIDVQFILLQYKETFCDQFLIELPCISFLLPENGTWFHILLLFALKSYESRVFKLKLMDNHVRLKRCFY